MHNDTQHGKQLKGKLIELLSEFSGKEITLFSDFVKSPFYNKEKILITLLDELKKHHPGFKGKKFCKDEIYNALFPGKKYNDSILRNTVSKLLKLCEKFLSVQSLRSDRFNEQLSLLKELRSKKHDRLFQKHKTITEEMLDKTTYRNENYFFKRYQLEDISLKQQRDIHIGLPILNKQGIDRYHFLSNAFITQILKANAAIINSNTNIFGAKLELILMDEIELHFKKHPDKLTENLYLRYYYNSIKLFETEDEKYFDALTLIVNDDLEQLELNLRRDLLTLLTNYCYFKINKGELKFMTEQFRFVRLNIERKLYKSAGESLSHILFMNVVTCGLDAGEFKWVKEFIQSHQCELREEHRKNTHNFALALFNHRSGDPDKALEFASKILSDEMSYKHQLKSLYLKIYFDMKEVQSFYSHIDSYKHFVNNDRMMQKQNKNVILNYILFAKKIFDLRSKPEIDKPALEMLRRKIQSCKSVINKNWLLHAVDRI